MIKGLFFIAFFIVNTKTTLAQVDSMNIVQRNQFGIGCGYIPKPQPRTIEMLELVRQSNKTKLMAWLISPDTQLKVHGYIGLYFLQRIGMPLQAEEIESMKTVYNADSMIYYCEGCDYGINTSLKEFLRNKRLQDYYHWYIESGYKQK
jgi:hypothetical protein